MKLHHGSIITLSLFNHSNFYKQCNSCNFGPHFYLLARSLFFLFLWYLLSVLEKNEMPFLPNGAPIFISFVHFGIASFPTKFQFYFYFAGVKELMEYMKKEYSHENLRFWLAVQELRYGPGSEVKIKKKVKEIWE